MSKLVARLLFVGECRSLTAQRRGWTWEDGRLAAKPLFEALRSMRVDPAKHEFMNLWTDDRKISPKTVVYIHQQRARGRTVVARGQRVSREMARQGLDHVALVHPAARGKIRKSARYRAHVRQVLGPVIAPQKLARITNVSDVPGEQWVEKYELRDKRGRWKRLKSIPGNGQYAPGCEEVARWLRRMGVTHVEMVDAYEDPVVVKKGVHAIDAFVRLAHRVDEASEDM